MIKVLHVISSIDLSKGGTSYTVLEHLNHQSSDISNELVYLETSSFDNIDKGLIKYINRARLKDFFNKNFHRNLNNFDIIYFHGLWEFKLILYGLFALISNSKVIISPHGMLEPWSLAQNRFFKFIVLNLVQRFLLNRSNYVVVTSSMEYSSIRKVGVDSLSAILPNSINVDNYKLKDWTKVGTKRKIIFLSRIHVKKGLEVLFDSLAKLDVSLIDNLEVDIVGDGEVDYIDKLKNQLKSLSLEDKVRFTGPKYGYEKNEAICSAELFVLPSYSENFGNVVIESLACGVPVLTTIYTPWEILNIECCGWVIDNNELTFSNTLKNILELKNSELAIMGSKGRLLVEDKYSKIVSNSNYLKFYKWIKYGGEQPSFIYE